MSILKSIFQGYAESKHNEDRLRRNEYAALSSSPFLHSSEYLKGLMEDGTKEENEMILDHLYKHDACYHTWYEDGEERKDPIKSYMNIEKEIIDKYWKG